MDAGYLYLTLGFLGYFTPVIVAVCRNHKNMMPIFVVNLFFGWTLVGWVIPLAWSFSDNTVATHPSQQSGSNSV